MCDKTRRPQSFGSWLLTIDGARLDRWHAEWCA